MGGLRQVLEGISVGDGLSRARVFKCNSDYTFEWTCCRDTHVCRSHPVLNLHISNMVLTKDINFKVWNEDGTTYMQYVDGHVFEVFERDGEKWGRDDYGEFRLNGGSSYPRYRDEHDLNYHPCNAVMRFTMQRYGERRYCQSMAKKNFGADDGKGHDRCKHHVNRDNLMKAQKDKFETGATVRSYTMLFQNMEPHKRVVAIKLFDDLLELSVNDFDIEYVDEHIDTSEVEWYEGDEAVIEFPVARDNTHAAKALWFASLEFIKLENIQSKLFEDAFASGDAVGEREVVVAVTDDGFEVTDMDEHHLNLPLSRIIKDHKELLKIGGVPVDNDADGTMTMTEKEWVIELDEPPKPELRHEETPFDKHVDED